MARAEAQRNADRAANGRLEPDQGSTAAGLAHAHELANLKQQLAQVLGQRDLTEKRHQAALAAAVQQGGQQDPSFVALQAQLTQVEQQRDLLEELAKQQGADDMDAARCLGAPIRILQPQKPTSPDRALAELQAKLDNVMVVNQRDNLAMARDRQVAERVAASGFHTGNVAQSPHPHLHQPLPGAATFPGGSSHQGVFGELRQPGASPTQGFFTTPAAAQVPFQASVPFSTNVIHPQSTDQICTSVSGPSLRPCGALIKAGWLYCSVYMRGTP